MPVRRPGLRLALLLALAPAAAAAQAGAAPANAFGESWFRLTAGADRVSGGFGDWSSLGFRTALAVGRRDLVLAEGRWQEAFGDRGVYGGGGLRHAFGSKWFTTTTLGAGTGRFALPELRFDASLHRKVAPRDRVLLTAGFTAVRSKDVYRDQAAFGSIAVYGNGVVVEAGLRLNWSNPGSIESTRGFGAVTIGRQGRRFLVLRGGAGRESYQLIGTAQTLQAFDSREAGAEYEEWLGRSTSLVLGVEYYHNPYYHRTGGRLGFSRHW